MAWLLDGASLRRCVVAAVAAGSVVACTPKAAAPAVMEVEIAPPRPSSTPASSGAAQPAPPPSVARDRLTGIVQVACGDNITCGLSGDGAVVCWGDTYDLGRAGESTGPQVIRGVSGAEQIGAGGPTACARTKDHKVLCWGRAPFDLSSHRPPPKSRAEVEERAAPHVVALPAVKDLAVGSLHACALTDSGAVLCWGAEHPKPATVALPPSRAVATGLNNSCAIGDDGVLRCWGSNEDGALGLPLRITTSARAVVIAVEAPVAQITIGDQLCALDAKKRAVCFGGNDFGQAGDASRVGPEKTLSARPSGMKGFIVPSPRAVPGLAGVTQIAGGGTFSCALRDDHTIACFGNNELGGLGRPEDHLPHPDPIPIDGITTAQTLCVGTYHACAVVEGGAVMCWGYNAGGQLGRGTSSPYESTPAPVNPLPEE